MFATKYYLTPQKRENSPQVNQKNLAEQKYITIFLRDNLYIIGRFCLSVTFLLIYGSRSVFMGIHGSRLVIHSSRLVLMVFIGSRLVFHVSRLVVHGFS